MTSTGATSMQWPQWLRWAEEATASPDQARLDWSAGKRFSLERAQTITQDGQDLASNLALAVETRIERSQASVWQTILDVAAEIDAEMVVIGTHGATAVQSLLLGSVSDAVVHHASRPVLVVPAAVTPAAVVMVPSRPAVTVRLGVEG